MFGKLLLLFIGIPLIEMMILIKLGEMMGFWATINLVIITGFLGAYLAKLEGMRAWLNVQVALQRGEVLTEAMFDALMIFLAGVVLITPGLLTDIAGFLILIPFTRKIIRNALIHWFKKNFSANISNQIYDYDQF